MTMIAFDGFDRYSAITELPNYGVPFAVISSPTLSSTVPIGTGQSLRRTTGQYVNLQLGDFGGETYICGAHFRFDNVDNTQNYVFAIRETSLNTSHQLSLVMDGSSHVLEVRLGSETGTVLASGTTALINDRWYYIEWKFKVHNTAGLYAVYLDGLEEIAETTTVDTQGRTNNACIRVDLGFTNASNMYIDNFYLLDTVATPNDTYIGPCDIKMLDATGDNSTAWTATGAGTTNSDRIDDANPHDSDTTYVSSNTLNQKDLYTLANTTSGDDPISVKLVTIAKKTDSGARQIDTIISVSATEQTSTKAINTSYLGYADYFDSSDGSTTAWTASALDSALIGMELTS